MSEQPPLSLIECFGDMSDPRVQGCCGHKLVDMLVSARGASVDLAVGSALRHLVKPKKQGCVNF